MAGEIVIGYDGSDGANAALARAVELASRLGAELVIFYGFEVSRIGGEVADLEAALRERGEQTAGEAAAKAREAGLEPRVVVAEGDPARTLAELGAESDAAMIAVGTHGERPIAGVFLGSLAHKLLHVSSVPVLVVPA